MTGKELARAIQLHKGKVQVEALMAEDVAWIFAEKSDLIRHFKLYGDRETRMRLAVLDSGDTVVMQEY